MSATHFLTVTITIIILLDKLINLSAETETKPTINKCCNTSEHVISFISGDGSRGYKCSKNSDHLDPFELKIIYNKDLHLTNRSFKDVFKLDFGIFVRDENFKNNSVDYSIILNTYLTETGTLLLEAPNEANRWTQVNSGNFCLDILIYTSWKTKEVITTHRFWGFLPDEETGSSTDPFYVSIGLFTSCVFLALVLVVYSLLPELRNLNGLVLMAYVASLFTAFLFLATLQVGQFFRLGCRLLNFFFYFSILASFCWMNVMSYDIWSTFRGFTSASPMRRAGKWSKFNAYCAYAFGVPLAMTVFFITVDQVPMRHLPWFVTPNLRFKRCFLDDGARLRYLYIPMLILILINWLFFLMTCFDIWRLHRQTAILDTAAAAGTRAAHRQHRARMLLYLKLSIIMGINWLLEVVGSFAPHLKIWILFDGYNFLVGISIFLIFVGKKKILIKLKKRYRAWRNSDTSYSGVRSHSSQASATSSNASQEVPLKVSHHPDSSFKLRNLKHSYEFN